MMTGRCGGSDLEWEFEFEGQSVRHQRIGELSSATLIALACCWGVGSKRVSISLWTMSHSRMELATRGTRLSQVSCVCPSARKGNSTSSARAQCHLHLPQQYCSEPRKSVFQRREPNVTSASTDSAEHLLQGACSAWCISLRGALPAVLASDGQQCFSGCRAL